MLHRGMVLVISLLGFLYEVILMHYVEKTVSSKIIGYI
jgi:hypothetical protein